MIPSKVSDKESQTPVLRFTKGHVHASEPGTRVGPASVGRPCFLQVGSHFCRSRVFLVVPSVAIISASTGFAVAATAAFSAQFEALQSTGFSAKRAFSEGALSSAQALVNGAIYPGHFSRLMFAQL